MALPGFIVIHHHGVQTQNNHFGLFEPQPPEEELLQQTAEEPDAKPGKRGEKPFDRMRGQHILGSRLDDRGISSIFFQGIKVNQVAAGAVHQEAQHLLGDLRHRLSLGAFADGAKKALQNDENIYVSEISNKKAQAGPGRQGVGSCLNFINNVTLITFLSHSSVNDNLPPKGFSQDNAKLTHCQK